jgi:hypothetical protein
MQTNVKFHLIDHCLPDYFRGHHLPVIQIGVYSNMTCGQVLKEILSEVNQLHDYFCDYTEEQISEAANNWRKLYDLRKNFVKIDKEDRKAIQNEDGDAAYLFFVCGVLHRPCSIFNEIKHPSND